MSRLITIIGFILLPSSLLLGQTIVSTSSENRKIILESFTGINCVFCPNANLVSEGIKSNHPNNAYVINLHQGGLANPSTGQPDFRTTFGDPIAAQTNILGYPAGTINRQIFPGQSQSGGNDTAMSRTEWLSAANEILSEISYVNLAAEAIVDVQNSEIDVHVEAYYTGNSPASTNLLNVALLQNHTTATQAGANGGENYQHNYRLLHLITGQWGETISTTTQGSFIDRNYNYSIPSNYNDIPVALDDLEIVVFMTETTQQIISGNGAYPSFINLPLNTDISLEEIRPINEQCGIDFGPTVEVQNNGNNSITSIDFSYTINSGAAENWTWTGSLNSFQTEIITLPPIAYNLQATNTIDVNVPMDENNANNLATENFIEQNLVVTSQINLILNTNASGNETTWSLRSPTNQIIASGGPYADHTSIVESFSLTQLGCYEFKLIDAGANGSNSVVLYDANNTIIYQSPGTYGDGFAVSFIVDNELEIPDNTLSKATISPNPASTFAIIKNASGARYALYNLIGVPIQTMEQISEEEKIDLSNLPAGTYFLQLQQNEHRLVKKLIVAK